MPHVEHHKQDQAEIGDEEIRDAEGRDECREPLRDDDEDVEKQPVPWVPRLPHGLVREKIARDVAGLQSPHEGKMAGVQRPPRDESGHAGDVEEPVEHRAAGIGDIHESEKPKGSGERNAVVGNSVLVGFLKDPRRQTLLGQSDQDTAPAVDVGVGRREHHRQQHAVDDMRQDADPSKPGGDDERRRVGIIAVREKAAVVGRHDQTNEENGQHEEEQNPKEGLADGRGHSLPGIFGLGRCDTHEFSPLVRESSLDQNGPKPDEFSRWIGLDGVIRDKRPRVHPVTEPQIPLFSHPGVDANRKNHEPYHREHLDTGEPKLQFPIKVDREEIEQGDDDPEDGDEYSDIDRLIPELDDEARSRELEGKGAGPGEPIDPAHGKTETGVDQARGIGGERSGNGNVGGNLSQRSHDGVDDGSDEAIGDQGANGATIGNCSAAADEETCADSTA